MVVYLVGGVTVVRCMHSGVTTIVTFANSDVEDGCEDQCDDDCKREASCLKVWVQKLSSAVKVHQVVHDFSIIQPLLYVVCNGFADVITFEKRNVRYSFGRLLIPPKVYLNIICVLII